VPPAIVKNQQVAPAKKTASGRQNHPDRNLARRLGETRIPSLIHQSGKFKTPPHPLRQGIPGLSREQFNFLRRSQHHGRILFLPFRLLDRMAHSARVFAVEGLFGGDNEGLGLL
ncbi:MAG: hypothetical protein ACKOAS_11805, partial [Verrucomicrobiota bacterium]